MREISDCRRSLPNRRLALRPYRLIRTPSRSIERPAAMQGIGYHAKLPQQQSMPLGIFVVNVLNNVRNGVQVRPIGKFCLEFGEQGLCGFLLRLSLTLQFENARL